LLSNVFGMKGQRRVAPKNLSVRRSLFHIMMDRKIASEVELLVQGMREVIEQLSADERKFVISSIRARSGDEVADRLEAPSGRNH
jgi:hypothetical protein